VRARRPQAPGAPPFRLGGARPGPDRSTPLGEGRGRDRAGRAYGHVRAGRPALAIAEVTAPAHRA
jgi:hypothetical protein